MEHGPQLQWRTWWEDGSKITEQHSRPSGIEISQDQLLGEGDYAHVQRQSVYDDHCLTFALQEL